MTTRTIDLSSLPAPTVVETLSFENIFAELLADLVERDPTYDALVESDPTYMQLEIAAYREIAVRGRVNDAARAVMVAHSVGPDLDQLGANVRVLRLVIDPGDPEAVPPVPPTYESNEAYRIRIVTAPEGYTVAGPRSAYEWHALSADGRVADAKATSPNPGTVVVALLSADNDGVPDAELLGIVEDALSADTVRPLTDYVIVQAAELIDYEITATLYLYAGPEAEPILAAAEAALQAYVTEQRRIGRDIRLSAIYAAAHVPGVQRVVLTAPTEDLVITDTEASNCTGVTVTLGGTDE